MSDSTTDTTAAEAEGQGGKDSGETPAAENGFKPITSQKQLNAVITERLDRERAKFKDYDDLKAKAAEFDKLQQANMSELEKANAKTVEVQKKLDEANAERDAAKAEAMRLRIAVQHGISLEDADLFLTGTDEETLTAQAKRLADRAAEQANADAERKKRNLFVPNEGTSTNSGRTNEDDEREFARAFFGAGGGA